MARIPILRGASGGRPRRAFTLLEVLLSTAIGVLLMGALYVAVDVQLRHAQAGRDLVEHGTLARALFARIVNDIGPTMAPAMPSTSSSSGGGGGAASTTGGTATSGTTGTSGTTDSSSTTSSSSSTTTASDATVFNLGVQGDSSRLVVSISRFPRELNVGPDAGVDPENLPLLSDIRRMTYWLAGGGEVPLGLARQEIKLVASDDLMSALPPDIPDEATHVIAEEVRSLNFRFWDGSAWQDVWDSTQVGADGVTPMGPPLGIEMVVGIASPGARGGANVKTYRHFIALPTANGVSQASQTTSTPQ